MTRGKIKCVVWDLDNTIWKGILSEDRAVTLRPGVAKTIRTLDERGVLNSIASRNNADDAMRKLREFNLHEYFIYPQINWNSKADSIRTIANQINIGMDSIAFIDDQPFERDEVLFSNPGICCMDASEVTSIICRDEFMPRFITEDSKNRRRMYQHDMLRKKAEEVFTGPMEDFLETLGMVFTISKAEERDLQRMEELTVRTHQLNTTGYIYSYDELRKLMQSDQYLLLVTELEDRYGSYGKIGMSLVERGHGKWTIKLLLMSCRVMSRGVGTILLNHILQCAKRNHVKLLAEFVPTDRNRMMIITYKFAGFYEIVNEKDRIVFQHDLEQIQEHPSYIRINYSKE